MDVAIGSLLGAVTALLVLLLDRRLSRRQRLTELYLDLRSSILELSQNVGLSLYLRPPERNHLDLDLESRFDTESKHLVALAQEGVLQTSGILLSPRLRRVRRNWSMMRRTIVAAGANRQKLAGALAFPLEPPAGKRFIDRLDLPPATEIVWSKLRPSSEALLVAIMNERDTDEMLAEFAGRADGAARLQDALEQLGDRILPERRALFRTWIDDGALSGNDPTGRGEPGVTASH